MEDHRPSSAPQARDFFGVPEGGQHSHAREFHKPTEQYCVVSVLHECRGLLQTSPHSKPRSFSWLAPGRSRHVPGARHDAVPPPSAACPARAPGRSPMRTPPNSRRGYCRPAPLIHFCPGDAVVATASPEMGGVTGGLMIEGYADRGLSGFLGSPLLPRARARLSPPRACVVDPENPTHDVASRRRRAANFIASGPQVFFPLLGTTKRRSLHVRTAGSASLSRCDGFTHMADRRITPPVAHPSQVRMPCASMGGRRRRRRRARWREV